jgi:glutamine synthetase
MKDSYSNKSLFTRIKTAIEDNDLALVSNLQIELDNKMKDLRELYLAYSKNLLDI